MVEQHVHVWNKTRQQPHNFQHQVLPREKLTVKGPARTTKKGHYTLPTHVIQGLYTMTYTWTVGCFNTPWCMVCMCIASTVQWWGTSITCLKRCKQLHPLLATTHAVSSTKPPITMNDIILYQRMADVRKGEVQETYCMSAQNWLACAEGGGGVPMDRYANCRWPHT